MTGGRFGTWYATLASWRTGVLLPSWLVNVSRYCRNRADGAVTVMNCVADAGSVHADQPRSAASCTLTLRNETVTTVATSSDPVSRIMPMRLIWPASSTVLVYVPFGAKP